MNKARRIARGRWRRLRRPLRPRYHHANVINALFDRLVEFHRASAIDASWLEDHRAQALGKRPGWTARLEAYLRGLSIAGVLPPALLQEIVLDVSRCVDSEPKIREFVFAGLWTAWVAFVALSIQSRGVPEALWTAIKLITAVFGAMWALQRPWLRRIATLRTRWPIEKALVISAMAVIAVTMTVTTASGVGLFSKWWSKHEFDEQHAALATDPQGFPAIRTFATQNFRTDVYLGDVDDSWALAELDIPNGSIASMNVAQAQCQLNIDRANVLRSFMPEERNMNALRVQGVMVHELAHCLDIRRDIHSYDDRTVSTYSIAPVDAKGVTDGVTYRAAARRTATQLWREAVADAFAVGYWRMTAPPQAPTLIAGLRKSRTEHAKEDHSHATACWIDQAARAPLPVDAKELFRWAEAQRRTVLLENPGGSCGL